MNTTIGLDKSELLLWTILRNFETLALRQYELYVPVLATAEKKTLVELLVSQAPSNNALDGTNLSSSVKDLVISASGVDEVATLIIQGLLLEPLGQTIYQTFGQQNTISSFTQNLCSIGLVANKDNRKKTIKLIVNTIGEGDKLFQIFMTVTRPVLKHLDTLGEGLDEHFHERFQISFADLIGDFVSELIPICAELGIDRRKLIAYLTGALMGI